ncbi:ATP-binding cassette domain-containing protein [Lacticaseibacillus mingshuiensis]|uniref:ATP-binding cassette domain-containing protein n=1 Tax=Lacticaseibacillus mingshuiensis TaxID=2799574 RepID=A0ABW4CFM2_9LACO|nr:ATP-binding cassette domain-containing protein [Lacticaseibacillus mingshuiensis]
MITARDIQLSTRSLLIKDFSYDFLDGRLFLITAENGLGKTTLLRSMMGLVPLTHGIFSFDGAPSSSRSRDAFFWESSNWFNSQLTGRDYLNFVHGQWHSSVAVDPVVEYWGMVNYIRLPIRKYSLGMKQRLIIALYEVSGAKNLLMDEISNGLDEEARQLLYERLRAMADAGKCLVITSHYRDEIASFIDTQLTLQNRSILEVRL